LGQKDYKSGQILGITNRDKRDYKSGQKDYKSGQGLQIRAQIGTGIIIRYRTALLREITKKKVCPELQRKSIGLN